MMKNQILISGGVLVKPGKGKEKWFVVKNSKDETWEFPKIIVRKTESSVRAVLRMTGEMGGMRAKVLEEVGRYNATATNSGRQNSQRYIYYLMLHKADSGESFGFEEPEWLDYSHASKKLSSKKEKGILKQAKKVLREWEKLRKKRPQMEE
jgi:hypothetical protein